MFSFLPDTKIRVNSCLSVLINNFSYLYEDGCESTHSQTLLQTRIYLIVVLFETFFPPSLHFEGHLFFDSGYMYLLNIERKYIIWPRPNCGGRHLVFGFTESRMGSF